MKIAWISHSQKLGGAERSLVEAVQGLVAQGHEVLVVVPFDEELTEPLRCAGAQLTFIPSRWWVHGGKEPLAFGLWLHKLLSYIRTSARIRRFLKTARPDVVVTNTLTIPTGALAAKTLGLPHVWYIHEFGREDHGLHFDLGSRTSLFLIDRLSNRIIVNSRAMLAHFSARLPPAKLRLAYYAVEIPQVASQQGRADGQRCHLVLMGQITPGKRQEDAIRALALLIQKGLDVRLTLVGSEPSPQYSALIRRVARELEVEAHVEFVAFTENPATYLAAADIGLMCSSNEAFGRVTVEAMKLGKPVVGTRKAGTIDLIEDGVRGFLYPVGDIAALAEKIELLCRDEELRSNMGKNAQAWALQTFNTEAYASTLIRVFEEAVARKGGSKHVKAGSAPADS